MSISPLFLSDLRNSGRYEKISLWSYGAKYEQPDPDANSYLGNIIVGFIKEFKYYGWMNDEIFHLVHYEQVLPMNEDRWHLEKTLMLLNRVASSEAIRDSGDEQLQQEIWEILNA